MCFLLAQLRFEHTIYILTTNYNKIRLTCDIEEHNFVNKTIASEVQFIDHIVYYCESQKEVIKMSKLRGSKTKFNQIM